MPLAKRTNMATFNMSDTPMTVDLSVDRVTIAASQKMRRERTPAPSQETRIALSSVAE
jgi:hypothetical protein